MVELVGGVGAVSLGLEFGSFQEPRVPLAAHLAGELAGEDAATVVDEPLGQHHGGWQVVRPGQHRVGHGGDAGPVAVLRLVAVETGGELAPAGQHHQVSGGVVVGGMGQRPHQRPQVRAGGQAGQVLADLHAGGACGDGLELAADVRRRVRFHVEAVVLAQPARQENKDHRPAFAVARG